MPSHTAQQLNFTPRVMRPPATIHYLGSQALLTELTTNYGLKPIIKNGGQTSYLLDDVDAALNRYILTAKQ